MHRANGLAAMKCANGDRFWYVHGQLHREGDKPATVLNYGSRREWFLCGKRHRAGGRPAVIVRRADNSGYDLEWWVDGVKLKGGRRPV